MRYLKYTYGKPLSQLDVRYKKKRWYFEPPQDVIDAGVAKRQWFKNRAEAYSVVPSINQRIDKWRRGEVLGEVLTESTNLFQLLKHYLESDKPNLQHKNRLTNLLKEKVGERELGTLNLNEITCSLCRSLYDRWKRKEGIPSSNLNAASFSVILRYAMSLDLLQRDAMSLVKKDKYDPDVIVWTKDQVVKFLDTAFSRYRWRNVGILVFMSYELAQSLYDLRNLKWRSLNLEAGEIRFKRKDNGVEVVLPISDDLKDMLVQQKKDFAMSEYVIPNNNVKVRVDKPYKPFTSTAVGKLINEILKEAKLPSELRARQLRTTAIVEMAESGADPIEIMAVTGHKTTSSIERFTKSNIKTTTRVLSNRKGPMV